MFVDIRSSLLFIVPCCNIHFGWHLESGRCSQFKWTRHILCPR